jgi:hypothetical protein
MKITNNRNAELDIIINYLVRPNIISINIISMNSELKKIMYVIKKITHDKKGGIYD